MALLLLLVAIVVNLSIGSACNPAASMKKEIFFDENVSLVRADVVVAIVVVAVVCARGAHRA